MNHTETEPSKADRQKTLLNRFRTAVDRDNVAEASRLLETEPFLREQINAPIFGFDSPPILRACWNREMVDLLLKHGADINRKSTWWAGGWGVLEHVNRKMGEFLISRGAIVDVFAAANLNRLDRLREFLDADPSLVHAKGGDGCRPLHFAKTIDAIDLLLDRGAEIDARDVDHEATAAQWMIPSPRRGDPGIEIIDHALNRVRHLLRHGAQPDVFMLAAVDDAAALEALLHRDPQAANARTGQAGYPPCPVAPGRHHYVYSLGDGKFPHQVAAEFGSRASLAILMVNSDRRLRLLAVCSMGDISTARAELDKNPRLLQTLTADDQRALPIAAWNEQLPAVRMMLELGFDPLTPNTGGETSLHCAAWQGAADIVRCILDFSNAKGLTEKLINAVEPRYSSTPLGWCCHGSTNNHNPKGDHPAVARMLLEAGAKPSPNYADAAPAVAKVIELFGKT